MRTSSPAYSKSDKIGELIIFHIGDGLYGIDILKVQEINKLTEITFVPQAPEYVKGILNLRGQIVTIIDLRKKLGLDCAKPSSENRNIIVNSQNESIGLWVDKVDDVIQVEWDKVEPPPPNIGNIQRKIFSGVLKFEKKLIGILDIEEILKYETTKDNRDGES